MRFLQLGNFHDGRIGERRIELIEQVANRNDFPLVARDERGDRVAEFFPAGRVPSLEQLAHGEILVQADAKAFCAQQLEKLAEGERAHSNSGIIRPSGAVGNPALS